jgi:predicted acyltransferase
MNTNVDTPELNLIRANDQTIIQNKGRPKEPSRLKSIDVFRGALVAAMILVNAQFSHEESYRQLAHAAWNGWTFADTIFPCFLFIVGVSLTLSTTSRVARGQDRSSLLAHALRRSILIFGFGVLSDYVIFPSHEFLFVGFAERLKLTGALQHIAICYLVASHIYLWTGLRGVIIGIIGLNLMYLGLLDFYPLPGCAPGSLAVSCNFPDYLNEIVPILPMITSVLFGVLAGMFLQCERHLQHWLLWLLGAGIILIAAGEILSMWVPINKHLYTTSYVVFMAGLAATGLACSIWLVDGRPLRRWFRPLEILGLNAIAAYLISMPAANVPRVHVMGKSLYTDVLAHVASPPNASLLFASLVLAAVYLAVWFMDRRGWHLKA